MSPARDEAPTASVRLLVLLGLPTFGLSVAVTMVTTYLPLILHRMHASSTVVGLVIGGEGVFGIVLPIVVGAWSDRLDTARGGRLPLIIGAAPVAALALVLMPFGPSVAAIAAAVCLFYLGYFVFYPPYRALYPDLLPPEFAGRAQSAQALWRGAGLLIALATGGLLFGAWQALPFLIAAACFLAVTATFVRLVGSRTGRIGERSAERLGMLAVMGSAWRRLRSDGRLRAFMGANALWEFSFGAVRTFVVLWLVVGLGVSSAKASAAIGIVAVMVIVAAAISGRIGDRIGVHRLILLAGAFYAVGLAIPIFTTSFGVLGAAVPFVAFGGAVAMTLPYALLMQVMPADAHGMASGLFDMSRGVGIVLGPLVAGVLIDALRPALPATHGYAAMWIAAAAATALSLPLAYLVRPGGPVASRSRAAPGEAAAEAGGG